jgi:acetoacetyl-CoA synthetase
MASASHTGIHDGDVIWVPPDELVKTCGMTRYLDWLRAERNLEFDDYASVWQWSVDDLDAFWRSVWDFEGVVATGEVGTVVGSESMPATRWFPGVALNWAENLFRKAQPGLPALIWVPEEGEARELSWEELRRQAGAMAQLMRQLGVERGDRIVAYVPSCPEAVVLLVACASIGAVWAACAPEYGIRGVISRFSQLRPKVLLATDGYRFGGRDYPRHREVDELIDALPSLEHVLWLPLLDRIASPPLSRPATQWADALAIDRELTFERLPFDHPLWVLFSSGTTGTPKGIVHGHGGIIIEQLKMDVLHYDLRPGTRLLEWSTPSWVIWNIGVSALLAGATAVLVDGSPTYPELGRIWRVCAEQGVEVLGLGAAYIHACMKEGLDPQGSFDLRGLRELVVTGSPLSTAAFVWVRDHVGEHVWVASTSGGTDTCTAFVGGSPLLPVRAGRIQAKYLGVAVEAWGERGESVVGTKGELVITKPMPSMPVCFWDDPDSERYRASYFEMFPGVWRHGDFIEFDLDGSSVIYGRSDGTLNRLGVRIGSAEIYAVVEAMPEVAEALVVGAELEDGSYYMPLFVVLEAGVDEDSVRRRIISTIREQCSPRHVPDEILVVPGVPHTKTGKKLEVPVKRLLQGVEMASVVDLGSVDDPELLEVYAALVGARPALLQDDGRA